MVPAALLPFHGRNHSRPRAEPAPTPLRCCDARTAGRSNFVTLTRFDSLDAIRAFAGDDYEMAVIEPQALALLSHYDERALHFDTASFRT